VLFPNESWKETIAGDSPSKFKGKAKIMNNGDFIPDTEAQFTSWYQNFITQCEKHEAVLGLDSESYGALAIENSAYNTAYSAVVSGKEELKGKTATKNLRKKASVATIRSYAKQWKSNPAIPAAVLNDLGIVATSTTGPVATVTGLDVTGCDDGVNNLTWNRTGNVSGTNFIIEAKIGSTGNWFFVGSTTKVKFDHTGQVPGQLVWYRITSSRAGENSVPCPAVAVYGPSASGELRVAA
jgi:hypothetical protein